MTHVLIVDDSPTDVEAMRRPLEAGGLSVSVAQSAQTGFEFAKGERPDLILMDVVFDGMSGFQGTRRLARDPETAGIPVIIVSGKNQESDRVWGLRQGAAEYLVKPVDSKALMTTVSDVLARHAAKA